MSALQTATQMQSQFLKYHSRSLSQKPFALIFLEAAMPHLQPLSNEEAGPQAQELFDKLQSAFKMVPNIFRTMGHAPSVLEATMSFDWAIHSDLDAKLRELAYLKTSKINKCNY
jgi:alkylhydroperoxidase family enzyme